MLKDSLIKIQESIKNSVNGSIDEIKKLQNIPDKKLAKIIKKCQIDEELGNIEMPQNQQSVSALNDILKLNSNRFKKFAKTVVNPASVAQLINELSETHIKDVKLPKSPDKIMQEIN